MAQERQPISTVGVGSIDRSPLNERYQAAPRAGGEEKSRLDSEGAAPAVKGEGALFARPYQWLEEHELRQLVCTLWRRKGVI